MDYDATDLPAGYDRARGISRERMASWMREVARHAPRRPVERIVDVGCGTGRFSPSLAGHFGAQVVGVDPSRRMLGYARAKAPPPPGVRYVAAAGEALPLARGWADLVFSSMAFHHFADPERVARECRRVLREQGVVFVRTGTLDSAGAYPCVPFFPETLAVARRRLPTRERICGVFGAAGFRSVVRRTVTQQVAATHAEYAERLAAGGDSILAELAPAAFDRGLAALRAHAAEVDPLAVDEPVDVLVFA